MADIKGVLTQLSNVLPQGLDGTRIAQWMLKDGYSYDTVRADVVAAMNSVNLELLSGWGDLVYVTMDDHFEYPQGGTLVDFQAQGDLSRPDPYKGTTAGHMIDLWRKGRGFGGTDTYFRDARKNVIDSSVAGIVRSGRNTFEKDILTRFFNNSENALGSSGYDVGWCDASSTVTFAPMAWGGKTFTTAHQHYTGLDTAGSTTKGDMLDALALNLNEHGHEPPYMALIPEVDVATYRNLAHYIQPINVAWREDRGGETTGNRYFMDGTIGAVQPVGGRFIGMYDSGYGAIYLKASNRIPTNYAGMYKSYGQNDPRNPIAIRVHPAVGFGFYIAEIPNYVSTWPVKTIEIWNEYGVSSNGNGGFARTNGAASEHISGGVYVNPVIS